MTRFILKSGKYANPLLSIVVLSVVVFCCLCVWINKLLAKNRELYEETKVLEAEILCRKQPNSDFLGETYKDEHIGKYIEMVGVMIRYINLLEAYITERDANYMQDVAEKTDQWLDFMETVVRPMDNGECPAYEDYWYGLESIIDSLAQDE